MSNRLGYYIAIPFCLISLAILVYTLFFDKAPEVSSSQTQERVRQYKELLERQQHRNPNAAGTVTIGGRTFEAIPNTAYRLLAFGFDENGNIHYSEDVFGSYIPLEDGRISPGTRVLDLDGNLEIVREFTSTGDEMTEEEVISFLRFLAGKERIPALAADRPDSLADVSTREQKQVARAVMELLFAVQGGMETGVTELRQSDPETTALLERHLGSLEAVMERVRSARQIRKMENENNPLNQR